MSIESSQTNNPTVTIQTSDAPQTKKSASKRPIFPILFMGLSAMVFTAQILDLEITNGDFLKTLLVLLAGVGGAYAAARSPLGEP